MKGTSIVIADIDEKYVRTLEVKFLEELGEKINLEVITEKTYLETYFSTPRELNALIVGESMFSESLCRHNIDSLFVLREEVVDSASDQQIRNLYKFSSANSIFRDVYNVLLKRLTGIQESLQKGTRIITVTSACGGTGKTTVAMGLAAAFAARNYRVLYLDVERLHTFQGWFAADVELDDYFYDVLLKTGAGIYEKIKKYIREEMFFYVPPFKSVLCNLGISMSVYTVLIKEARASGDFDIIVADTDPVFDEEKGALIAVSDTLITVVNQDGRSIQATNCMLKNMQMSSADKFLFVCGNYENNRPNELSSTKSGGVFHVAEYVGHIEPPELLNLKDLRQNKDFQRLSYLIMD